MWVRVRVIARKGDYILDNWATSSTGEYKGRTKAGNAVWVTAHGIGPLADADRIEEALDRKNGLVNGAMKLTKRKEWHKLLGMEDGKNVIVDDFDKIAKLKSGAYNVDEANNLLLQRRAGGEAQAEAYLKKHKKVYGSSIRNWHDASSVDLDVPQGRVVFVGDFYDYGDLSGDYYLDDDARFFGVGERSELSARSADAQNSLDATVQSALSSGSPFEHNGTLYVPVDPKSGVKLE